MVDSQTAMRHVNLGVVRVMYISHETRALSSSSSMALESVGRDSKDQPKALAVRACLPKGIEAPSGGKLVE